MKAHAFAILSRMPGGRVAYRAVRRFTGRERPESDSLERAVDLLHLYVETAGARPYGTVLEVGTGWFPYAPIVLRAAGAERVITVDINPWLTLRTLRATCIYLQRRLAALAAAPGVDIAVARELVEAGMNPSSLDAWLRGATIEYWCPVDAGRLPLPDGSVDAVVSSNVAEHATPEALTRIHAEAYRLVRASGVVVHRCDPADHFSFGDRSITSVNFLRFSPAEWHWYGGSGLSYHNRLRAVDHARMVARAGFEITIQRTIRTNRSVDAITSGAVPVHADFAQYSPEELADDYLWLGARRTR